MAARLPPVPPAARPHHGEGPNATPEHEATHRKSDSNTHEQGDHANVEQNTTIKNHAGDR